MTDNTADIDPWKIPHEKVGTSADETIFKHSEKPLDRLVADAKAAGGNRVRAGDVPLTPQRKLLHGVIVEMATRTEFADAGEMRKFVKELVNSDEYRQAAATVTHDSVDDVAKNLAGDFAKANHLHDLPAFPKEERHVLLMMGGPAAGKTTMRDAFTHRQRYAGINPGVTAEADSFRELLGDPKEMGGKFSDLTHEESKLIVDEIRRELDDRMVQEGKAPNLIIDRTVVRPEDITDLSRNAGHVQVHGTMCPIEDAVERAAARGAKTRGLVSTEANIAVHKRVAKDLPELLSVSDADVVIYDNDVPKGTPPFLLVEKPKGGDLKIYDAPTLNEYLNHSEANTHATSPSALLEGASPKPLHAHLEMLADANPRQTIIVNERGTDRPIAEIKGKKLNILDETEFRSMVGDDGFDKLVQSRTPTGSIHTKGEAHERHTQTPEEGRIAQRNDSRDVGGGSGADGSARSGHSSADGGAASSGIDDGAKNPAGTRGGSPETGGTGIAPSGSHGAGTQSLGHAADDIGGAARKATESMRHLDAGAAMDVPHVGGVKPSIPKPGGGSTGLGGTLKRAWRSL